MIATILHLHESARASFEMFTKLRCGFAHAHDIGDTDAFGIMMRITQGRPSCGVCFFFIADHAIDFRHRRKHSGINLRCTARHDDAGVRLLAFQTANGLPRLAHGFACHSACVHNREMAMACFFRRLFHRFGFSDVETATKGEKIDSHQAVSKIAGSNWPECSSSTGPVIKT